MVSVASVQRFAVAARVRAATADGTLPALLYLVACQGGAVVSGEPSRMVVSASYGPGPLPGLAGTSDPTVPWQTVLSRPHASGVSSGIWRGAPGWAAICPPPIRARADCPSRGSTRQTRIPSFAWTHPVCLPPADSPLRWAAHTTTGSPGVQRAGQATGISSARAHAHGSTTTDASAWRARWTSSHGALDRAHICGSWRWRKMTFGSALNGLRNTAYPQEPCRSHPLRVIRHWKAGSRPGSPEFIEHIVW